MGIDIMSVSRRLQQDGMVPSLEPTPVAALSAPSEVFSAAPTASGETTDSEETTGAPTAAPTSTSTITTTPKPSGDGENARDGAVRFTTGM